MILTENFMDNMSTDILVESVANDIAKWNRDVQKKTFNKYVNFTLSRPEHLVIACSADVRRFRVMVSQAKTREEKAQAKAAIKKGLANIDKIERMRLDKSNIIPGLDKAIKQNSFDKYRRICNDLLDKLN